VNQEPLWFDAVRQALEGKSGTSIALTTSGAAWENNWQNFVQGDSSYGLNYHVGTAAGKPVTFAADSLMALTKAQ